MSKVRNKDSKIEVEFRKNLWAMGFRYRKNDSRYFGKPDVVLPRYKTVIFVDSCFWHGCKRHGSIPETRQKFWQRKLEQNKQRDKEVTRYYRKCGWQVHRVWEHDLKIQGEHKATKPSRTLTEFEQLLKRSHVAMAR